MGSLLVTSAVHGSSVGYYYLGASTSIAVSVIPSSGAVNCSTLPLLVLVGILAAV